MVNSVPPAKSMPSRKPFVAIDRMPGMMIRREMKKKMLRRPVMLSRRTRGSGRGISTGVSLGFSAGSAMSAACPAGATSDSSDTAVHPHQPGTPECTPRHHDGEEVVRDDDRGDEAGDDADAERAGKPLGRPRTHGAQEHPGEL